MEIGEKLIAWYEKTKRDLPWRRTKDPYKIWISEVILQQTRVEQGIPYYHKFIENFPSIEFLANCQQDELMKLWEGLGYYSRARNLHKAAKQIVEHHSGNIPDNYQDLLKISGIGPYTAAAIASIAYKLPHAVVDGNVQRVISRLFGIEQAVNSLDGKKIISEIAEKLLIKNNSSSYNQAIMELGALICKPRKPECEHCPVNEHCVAFEKKKQEAYPVKLKKNEVKNRFFSYHFILTGKNILLRRRPEGDIWTGLWEPILNELTGDQNLDSLNDILNSEHELMVIYAGKQQKHLLTHQRINYQIKIMVHPDPEFCVDGYEKINIEDIHDKAFPIHIKKFLKSPEISALIDKYSE